MIKMKHTKLPVIIALVTAIGLLGACSNNDDGPDSEFDRVAMLTNYANNYIIPSYQAFKNRVDELQSSTDNFSNNPTEANLTSLQDDLKAARLAWQDVSLLQFGPAETNVLRTSVNIFPTNVTQINSNIDSGNYDLGTLENQAARGFPALGYLLHGLGSTNQEIVSHYTDSTDAAQRMAYLNDVVTFIKQKTDATVDGWSSNGGDYLNTFTSESNAGTDVGSSIGMMVNALILHYERFLRDGKIGIPAGVRSAGVPRPSAVEALYGGYSTELAIANMEAVKKIYLGNGFDNSEGLGLEEHIDFLGANELAIQITTELDEAIDSLQVLNDPLSTQIENNNEPVLTAFTETQDLVTLMKADMASILGVTITFQDNDGD